MPSTRNPRTTPVVPLTAIEINATGAPGGRRPPAIGRSDDEVPGVGCAGAWQVRHGAARALAGALDDADADVRAYARQALATG